MVERLLRRSRKLGTLKVDLQTVLSLSGSVSKIKMFWHNLEKICYFKRYLKRFLGVTRRKCPNSKISHVSSKPALPDTFFLHERQVESVD